MRLLALCVLAALLFVGTAHAAEPSAVMTRSVSFRVLNPLEPFFKKTVRGTIYTPADAPNCSSTVILLLHGLSYGAWAWDFPVQRETYSMARMLASRGYPVVAIDELGYGSSDHPLGWNLTVESYGDITAQIVRQLKRGGYSSSTVTPFQRVVLFGHSAGTEMAELAVGLHRAGDGLIAGAYSHAPSTGILMDVIASDTPRALLSPYIYFGGNAAHRAGYMFNRELADPAIVERDTALANLTPSGEILTIGSQPSRAAVALITKPVFLVMAEKDALFPPALPGVDLASVELALFLAAPDRSLHVVPGAGHTFMLHPNAPQTQQVIHDWLRPRFPACAQ